MNRARIAAAALGGLAAASMLAAAVPAGASGASIKVSPSSGLTNGKVVHVTGTGLPVTTKGKKNSFFAAECTSAVSGSLSLADEKYCNISAVRSVTPSSNGSFSVNFKVITGKVGTGTCGTQGATTCVIGIGDVAGQGAVARITFK